MLTPKEAGEYLGVHTHTIYNYTRLKNNPLPCFKISRRTIRIDIDVLEKWITTYNSEEGER